MRNSHTLLKESYRDKDIWVLGSGASLGFITQDFFNGKITIGSNRVWQYYPLTYTVCKHTQFIQEAIDNGQTVIASKHDCGDIDHPLNKQEGIHYIFTHKRGRFGDLEGNFEENLKAIGEDEDIFVSHSTITSCIHLAAYMGAKNIILAGHDCGWIDGKSHMHDYGKRLEDFHKKEFNRYHNTWFGSIVVESERLRDKLKEVYGCNIHSLNPFLNLGMEGHKYDSTKQ